MRDPESSAEPVLDSTKPRILVGVVDPRAGATIRRALGDDFDLFECENDAAVLEASIAEPAPALILIDAAHPDFRAWKVCEVLHGDRRLRKIPILVLIEHKEWRWQAPKVYEVGGSDHLRRPFDEATLRARVDLHLELRKLREVAGTALAVDPATEVADQRGVEEYVDVEWKRAAREATPLSIVLLKVDDFLGVEEARGKPYADECLRRIAAEITVIIRRPMDFLGRWESDGFAVVLPVTESSGASYLAELMRQGVETLTMLHPRPRESAFVTLSVGVATTVPYPDSTPDLLVAAAHRGVERASLRGGNLVRAVEPE